MPFTLLSTRGTKPAMVLLVGAFMLTACSESTLSPSPLGAAHSGIRTSHGLLQSARTPRTGPAAATGLQTSSALREQEGDTPLEDKGEESASSLDQNHQVVQTLERLLSTDVPQLLNRSPDRSLALDKYADELNSAIALAKARTQVLTDQRTTLRDKIRMLERGVKDVRKELDDAISEGRATQTSGITHDLVRRQNELVQAEIDLRITEKFLDAYKTILKPSEQRLAAVAQNRSALIRGVTVIDLPGAEELGILKK